MDPGDGPRLVPHPTDPPLGNKTMKKMLIGFALASLTLACASEKKAAIDDSTAPSAMCGDDCTKPCCAGDKAKCTEEQKAECKEQKVCPVSGQKIN